MPFAGLQNTEHVTIARLDEGLARSLAALRRDPGRVQRSRAVVDEALRSGETYYGINTGFGALARVRIEVDRLAALQRNLLLSHAVGVGDLGGAVAGVATGRAA